MIEENKEFRVEGNSEFQNGFATENLSGVEGYADFRSVTSKSMAGEVIDEALIDLHTKLDGLMSDWTKNLMARLAVKFNTVGLESDMAVKVTWDPDPPSVEVYGYYDKENEDGA